MVVGAVWVPSNTTEFGFSSKFYHQVAPHEKFLDNSSSQRMVKKKGTFKMSSTADVIISYTHLKHDVIISSYPPTYLYIFFFLINKTKIIQGLFLFKKKPAYYILILVYFSRKKSSVNWIKLIGDILERINRFQVSFLKKIPTFFSAHANKVFFLVYFLITSAFSHPHPPTLSSNIIIWPPHPPTSLMT